MKNIIAKTSIYLFDKTIKRFIIIIYQPEKDPVAGGDYRCAVKMTGTRKRYIHGIDTFQALNLAIYYIKVEMNTMLKSNIKFYFDKQKNCEFDVPFLINHDHRKYMKKRKSAQQGVAPEPVIHQ